MRFIKIYQIVSFILISFIFTNCSDSLQIPSNETLAGTWKIEKIEPADEDILEYLIEAKMTFSKDGKLESYSLFEDEEGIDTSTETAEYWTENDQIFIKNNGIHIGSFKFENDYLILTDPETGLTAYFVKVKE